VAAGAATVGGGGGREDDAGLVGSLTEGCGDDGEGGERESFWTNSIKILIYFFFLRFDPTIKRKRP